MSASLREQLLPLMSGPMKGCVKKTRYRFQSEAQDVMRKRRESGEVGPLFSYQCPHCAGWHLTRLEQPK